MPKNGWKSTDSMNNSGGICMESKKIGIFEKLGYSLTGLGDNLRTSFTGTFLLFFCTNVLKIAPGLASTIISVSVVWDAINDPLIANYADNHPFRNGERVRKYLIYASVPLALLLICMFSKFSDNPKVSAIIFLCIYLAFTVATTFHRLPYFSLLNLVSPNEKERLSVNSWRSLGGSVGVAAGSLVMWPLVRAFAGVDAEGQMINQEFGFFWGAVVIGVCVVAFSVVNYCTTRERVIVPTEEKYSIIESMKALFSNSSFCWNMLWEFLRSSISAGTVSYAVFYTSYVLGKPGMLTPFYACYLVAGLVVLPFVKTLVSKLGRSRSVLLASIVYVAGAVIFLIAPTKFFCGALFCVAIGFSDQIAHIVVSVNRASISDIVEKENGKRMDNMISNVTSFVLRCASALLTLVFGWVLEFSGYNADLTVQPASAVKGIIAIMGGSALLFSLILGLSTFRMNIDENLESERKTNA